MKCHMLLIGHYLEGVWIQIMDFEYKIGDKQ